MRPPDGADVGDCVGLMLGNKLNITVGLPESAIEGLDVAPSVGIDVGLLDMTLVGLLDGDWDPTGTRTSTGG